MTGILEHTCRYTNNLGLTKTTNQHGVKIDYERLKNHCQIHSPWWGWVLAVAAFTVSQPFIFMHMSQHMYMLQQLMHMFHQHVNAVTASVQNAAIFVLTVGKV